MKAFLSKMERIASVGVDDDKIRQTSTQHLLASSIYYIRFVSKIPFLQLHLAVRHAMRCNFHLASLLFPSTHFFTSLSFLLPSASPMLAILLLHSPSIFKRPLLVYFFLRSFTQSE